MATIQQVQRACKKKNITLIDNSTRQSYDVNLEAPKNHSFGFSHAPVVREFVSGPKSEFWASVLEEIESLEIESCSPRCIVEDEEFCDYWQ